MLSSEIGGVSLSDSKTGKVRIVYSKIPNYQLLPATGAWGGVSPQKEIIVEFYVDNRRNPESLDITTVDGKAVKEERTPTDLPIDRIMQCGIILRPDIARSIGQFLIAKADEAFVIEEKEEG